MHYVVKEMMPSHCSGTGRGYTFADAVARFGDLLCQSDLASAYKRAGNTFRGAMEHYFVVLKEGTSLSANQEPIGRPPGSRNARAGTGTPQRGRPGRAAGPSRQLGSQGSRKRPSGHIAGTPSKKKTDATNTST